MDLIVLRAVGHLADDGVVLALKVLIEERVKGELDAADAVGDELAQAREVNLERWTGKGRLCPNKIKHLHLNYA